MKHIFFTACLCGALSSVHCQIGKTLSLDECYDLARKNYPLLKQRELILKNKDYSIENVSKGYLPQLSFNGQATYQSDVTEIPIKIPNTTIPTISKDQYKIYTEADQTIFDGGIIKNQKQSIEATATVENEKLEVDLYNLRERINKLFFGILLAIEQDTLIEIQKNDIQNGIAKMRAAIANGTALKSSADVLEAELLKVSQHTIEIRATQKSYRDMLGRFIGQALAQNTILEKPVHFPIIPEINRPEIALFDSEKKAVNVRDKLLRAKNQPRIGLFFQAGYGRPALNMLKNDFEGYYIGGLRVSWPLTGLYTYKKDKALLENNRKTIDIQKETFLFNTLNTIEQQKENIASLRQLMQSDADIIALRTRIKNTALSQLDFGVINSSDYLREVNAEAEAKETQSLHEIQLLMAEYDQKTTSGN